MGKEFRYRLVFPSLLYLARTLPRQDVFRKYRNAIPEPRMLKFNDERSNVNFFKGSICLTETNILSLVWRSERLDRRWSYYDCVTKFFRSPGIEDVVKDCNGELLATFSSRSNLEQLLRNFCTPATDSLAKVVAAAPRAKLVHFQTGLLGLESRPPTLLSRDICSGYNCSVSLDQHRVLFRDKLDMIKFLRDPNKRTNSMRICFSNFELVAVSSLSKARSVDSEVEGKEKLDPATGEVEGRDEQDPATEEVEGREERDLASEEVEGREEKNPATEEVEGREERDPATEEVERKEGRDPASEEVEGREERDPATEVIEGSTLEYCKEVNEEDETGEGENV